MKLFHWPLWLPLPQLQRGMSMIELIVTMGIAALMMALALPHINSGTLNLPLVQQNLIGDIRMARASATSRGVHFKVSISSSSYTVQRLQDTDGDGIWEPDGEFPTRTVELPNDISIVDGEGSEIEFTTRGLLADQEDGTPAPIVTISLHDSLYNETKTVKVWPSGQVEEV